MWRVKLGKGRVEEREGEERGLLEGEEGREMKQRRAEEKGGEDRV